MEEKMIYVVMAHTGSFDTSYSYPKAAFTLRDAAEEYINAKNAERDGKCSMRIPEEEYHNLQNVFHEEVEVRIYGERPQITEGNKYTETYKRDLIAEITSMDPSKGGLLDAYTAGQIFFMGTDIDKHKDEFSPEDLSLITEAIRRIDEKDERYNEETDDEHLIKWLVGERGYGEDVAKVTVELEKEEETDTVESYSISEVPFDL